MAVQSSEQLLEMMRSYQIPCVLAAGVDLGVFGQLADAPRSAAAVAQQTGCDLRGMTILLDALAAIQVLQKDRDQYSIPAHLSAALDESSPQSVMAMLRHQGNCLRRWSRLPWTVRIPVHLMWSDRVWVEKRSIERRSSKQCTSFREMFPARSSRKLTREISIAYLIWGALPDRGRWPGSPLNRRPALSSSTCPM